MARADIIILGGGLVGTALALAAARKGFASTLIDRGSPSAYLDEGFDARASAISTASWNLFANIGLAARLEPLGCPIAAIAVSDQLKPGRIDFVPGPDDGSLGRMFANRDLRCALYEAAAEEKRITFATDAQVVARERGPYGCRVELDDGQTFEASLLVAAEGRASPTREQAGIPMARWDYAHRAIIAGLTHTKPHENVAWEIFYPEGPFALLPLLDDADGRHRSALVWTVAEKDANGVLKLTDRAFKAEVAARMGGLFGEVEPAGALSSWPLGFHHTTRIAGERLALVGDAAHGIHPIAGQGFNLGLRDVGALVETMAEGARLGLEPGDAGVLRRYERWRGVDTFAVALATDTLTRLFGLPGAAPSAVRRLGMAAVQRTGPLKRWFMDEARGVSGDLPALLRA
jgi:2-octaprenyl-6-methoxyphenol hydroxylase